MGALDLPDPVVRHPVGGSPVDAVALAEALRERVDGEVRFDGGSRAAYSTDASNFRQTPIGVVVPRTPEAAVEAVAVAREHGAPVLSRMFGEELVEAFGRLKAVFDPLNTMNPGKVVAPYGLDENLRLGGDWAPRDRRDLHFRFPHDGGSFAEAAGRCVGVGKCRQLTNDGGAVMCPRTR